MQIQHLKNGHMEMLALERSSRWLCAQLMSLTFKVVKAPVQQPLGTSDLKSFPWRINTCNERGNCCQKSVCSDQQQFRENNPV